MAHLTSQRVLGDGGDIAVSLGAAGGRGGRFSLGQMDPNSHFTRNLNRRNTAEVVVQLGTAPGELDASPVRPGLQDHRRHPDADVLSSAFPWITETRITWGGRMQWLGPTVKVKESASSLRVHAEGWTAWWDRREYPRPKSGDVELKGDPAHLLTLLAQAAINERDQTDPLRKFYVRPIEVDREATLTIREGEAPRIADLVRRLPGIDWTEWGRALWVCRRGQIMPDTPRIVLGDDDYAEPPELELNGDELASDFRVNGAEGVTAKLRNQLTYERTHLLVRQFNMGWLKTQDEVTEAARDLMIRNSNPVRISSIKLAPHAKVTLEQLIPGALVQATVSTSIRQVTLQQRLETVRVGFDGSVTITLGPFGQIVEADEEVV